MEMIDRGYVAGIDPSGERALAMSPGVVNRPYRPLASGAWPTTAGFGTSSLTGVGEPAVSRFAAANLAPNLANVASSNLAGSLAAGSLAAQSAGSLTAAGGFGGGTGRGSGRGRAAGGGRAGGRPVKRDREDPAYGSWRQGWKRVVTLPVGIPTPAEQQAPQCGSGSPPTSYQLPATPPHAATTPPFQPTRSYTPPPLEPTLPGSARPHIWP